MPWRVTYYEEGEEPYSDDMTRFADAWRLARPYPALDGLQWVTLKRYDVEAFFANGQNNICVSWVDQTTRTVLTKI